MNRPNQTQLAPVQPTAVGGNKPRQGDDENLQLPPTLTRAALQRIPPHQVQDAVQEAWVAYLSGQDPDDAIRCLTRRDGRIARRYVCFSQLEPEQLEWIYDELPE